MSSLSTRSAAGLHVFMSKDQVNRINAAFKVLGARGTSVFGSSGDGGSHFSFGPFSGGGALGNALMALILNACFPDGVTIANISWWY